jgi:Putative Actinobacterial Holin-X, holin superfamily III
VDAPRPDEKSIGELLQQLAEDGKAYAGAELRDAREMLWMGAVALVLAQAAAVALVVGLVLTLAPLVGPGLATLIVVLAFLAIAGLMGWLAWKHVKRIFKERP